MIKRTLCPGNRNRYTTFKECLPKRVQAAALTPKSKVPFKALVLREALVHRITTLALSAVNELKRESPISAAVLARAAVETTAAIFTLDLRVTAALRDNNDDDLNEFLNRSMVGTRIPRDGPQSVNVLTLVDKVENEFPGFRAVYDDLCEYAHPNWAGVLGAFSQLDKETLEVSFGLFDKGSAKEASLYALLRTLEIAHHFYNQLGDRIRDLNSAFERGDLSYDT